MRTLFYDTTKYNFAKEVRQIFGIEDLTKLHTIYEFIPLVERREDQSTPVHKHFYANDQKFLKLYVRFIQEIVKPFWGWDQIVFQTVPTFRVHLPNNLSVGEFHTDAEYGHSPKEINHILALTLMHDSNSIWIESEPNKKDYSSIYVPVGEILTFNGAVLHHGNKLNVTGKTRVSVDFRILKLEDYQPSNKRSIHMGRQFIIGDYYSLI